jgi:hypothetical protein
LEIREFIRHYSYKGTSRNCLRVQPIEVFMFVRKFITSTLAAILAFSPVASAATGPTSAAEGQFFFRYKTGVDETKPNPDDSQSKAITAFFVGAVGKEFREKLPLKTEWQDDDWRITKGSLPPGISFNSKTMEFLGNPTNPTLGQIVELTGYDVNTGEAVADASVSFDIFELVGLQPEVLFYGHTNQYTLRQLKLPAGITPHYWKFHYPAPGGLDISNISRNFDGTPTKAGKYPIMIQGFDYLDPGMTNPIISYIGYFIIEDTPTFNVTIPDQILPLGGMLQQANFLTPPASSALAYSVADPNNPTDKSQVLYGLEFQNGGSLFDLLTKKPTNKNNDVWIAGSARSYYQSVTVRYKAMDTDGSPAGVSNWFTLGTLGPTATCLPTPGLSSIPVNLTTNQAHKGTPIPVLTASYAAVKGTKQFTVKSGQFPDGITMDALTGAFSGTPTKEEIQNGVMVDVAVTNNGIVDPYVCGPYDFNVSPQQVTLNVVSGGYGGHVRVGKTFTGTITPGPAIALLPGYTISLDAGQTLPPGIGTNFLNGVMTVSGTPTTAGVYSLNFTFTNGDGRTVPASMPITMHDALKIDAISGDISIPRYDVSSTLATVTYNADAVVPGGPFQPLTLEGPVPYGFTFNKGVAWQGLVTYSPDTLVGGTRLAEGRYGPLRYKLEDAYREPVYSSDFYIDVTKRGDMEKKSTTNPVEFFLGVVGGQGYFPFDKKQPMLADDLLVKWTITPPTMPTDIYFDADSGAVSGIANENDRGVHGPYKITATDIEGYTATSDDFIIDVRDPEPILAKSIVKQQGNVGIAFAMEGQPEFWAHTLIGTQAQGTFTGADNTPPGLTMKPDGKFSGTPTGTFDGVTTVHFKDKANRDGEVQIRFVIYPELKAEMDSGFYEIARRADAGNLSVKPALTGFYKGAEFDKAPSSPTLPTGLSIESSSGRIIGTPLDPVGTVVSGVIIKATHKGTLNSDDTDPFDIKIGAQQTFEIEYPERVAYALDGTTLALVGQPTPGKTVTKSGSYTDPITYTFTAFPTGMGVDANGTLTGAPDQIDDWTVTVDAKDAEQRSSNTATFKIRGTLSGNVEISPGGEKKTVRKGESFETDVQTPSNHVGTVVYSLDPKLPATLSLNSVTGVLTGKVETKGNFNWALQAEDSHERKLSGKFPQKFSVEVIDELAKPTVGTAVGGKQYAPDEKLHVEFGAANRVMGKATYALYGDYPGTVYYKFYDDDDPSQLATYYHYPQNGDPTVVVRQQPTETAAEVEAGLSHPDHLIFDTVKLTLDGIPSRDGTFSNLGISAYDDHQEAYWDMGDATRQEYNTKLSDKFTITVAPADDLQIANSADSETLHQHTSTPKLTTTVSNAAYGLPVSWKAIRGSLPQNVRMQGGVHTLSYSGYPQVKGLFDDIVYEAKDFGGRTIESHPVAFEVVDRLPFKLKTPANPAFLEVNLDASVKVTPENSAYGLVIPKNKWTVTGVSNLPPGMGYTIKDGGVEFTGPPTTLGKYTGITIAATDSLGAPASLPLEFRVVASGDAIDLQVENVIQTKVGYDLTSSTPVTDNTYGKVRFYSYDLATYPEIKLDPDTGVITGNFSKTDRITFDLYVTDATNRVTSKPMILEIIPNLNIVVPTQVLVNQGSTLDQPIDTFYNLGIVSYVHSAGTLPTGISVNAQDGALAGYIDAAPSEYTGLVITGTDQLGDRQPSNTFSIKIVPTTDQPDIIDPANSKVAFGKVGTAGSFIPTVNIKNSKPLKSWTYGGSVYSLNLDITPYGLTLNPATGEISGTPTAPVLIKDMVMTVTSPRGLTDSTAAFWFYILPNPGMSFTALGPDSLKVHTGVKKKDIALSIKDMLGDVTYTNTISGVNRTVTINQAARTMDVVGNTNGIWSVTVTAKDEVGQTTQKIFNGETLDLLMSYTPVSIEQGVAYTGATPAITNAFGAIRYEFTGLPNGLLGDANTGIITGTTNDPVAEYQITIKAIDQSDMASVSTTYGVYLLGGPGHKYWKVGIVSTAKVGRQDLVGKIHMYDVAGKVLTDPSTVTVTSTTPGSKPLYLVSAKAADQYTLCVNTACTLAGAINAEITYTFTNPAGVYDVRAVGTNAQNSSSAVWLLDRSTAQSLSWSDDGVTWTDVPVDMTRWLARGYTYTMTLTTKP